MFVLTGVPLGRVRYVLSSRAPRRLGQTAADYAAIAAALVPGSEDQKLAAGCAANPTAPLCASALANALSTPYAGASSEAAITSAIAAGAPAPNVPFYTGAPPGTSLPGAPTVVINPPAPAAPSAPPPPPPAPPPPAPAAAPSVVVVGTPPPTNQAIQPGPTPGVIPTTVIQAAPAASGLSLPSFDFSGLASSVPGWVWLAAGGGALLLFSGGGHKRRRRY